MNSTKSCLGLDFTRSTSQSVDSSLRASGAFWFPMQSPSKPNWTERKTFQTQLEQGLSLSLWHSTMDKLSQKKKPYSLFIFISSRRVREWNWYLNELVLRTLNRGVEKGKKREIPILWSRSKWVTYERSGVAWVRSHLLRGREAHSLLLLPSSRGEQMLRTNHFASRRSISPLEEGPGQAKNNMRRVLKKGIFMTQNMPV